MADAHVFMDYEFILKPHTKYVIRYDNASSSSNVIGWSLHWYEEVPA